MLETANERRVTIAPPTPRPSKLLGAKTWTQLASLAGESMNIDDLMDWLIAWTHQTVGTAEVVNGSERFYLDHGKVFHDDSFYHARTSYFFDHFIFERRLSPQAIPGGQTEATTPFQLLLTQALAQKEVLPQPVYDRVHRLGEFRHSLFQIVKVAEKSMTIQDLLSRTKLVISAKAQETFRGLEKRTIFQAFVFPLGDIHQLSSGIILHPQKASRLIKKFIKRSKAKDDFSAKAALSRLAMVQIRYLRHRHVHPKLIYQAIKD